MSKHLKITDEKGFNHVVPAGNLAFYLAYNKRQKLANKWKIEELADDVDPLKIPLKDPDFIKPSEVLTVMAEKNDEIAALKKQLAELQNGRPVTKLADKKDPVDEVDLTEGGGVNNGIIDPSLPILTDELKLTPQQKAAATKAAKAAKKKAQA